MGIRMIENHKTSPQAIHFGQIWYLTLAGFILLGVLVLCDEVFDLPHILLGASETPVNWHEVIIEATIVLIVGCIFLLLLVRIIARGKFGESQMMHLQLVLRAIRNVNQLIVKEHDRDILLKDICRNLTENRDYPCAWVVTLDESGNFGTAAESGVTGQFPSLLQRLRSGDSIQCVEKALKQAEVFVTNDPSTECADCPLLDRHEGTAALTVRMQYGKRIMGVLAVHVPPVYAADPDEQSLLREVAGDIALALSRIEEEKNRRKAEQVRRESEERYRLHFENVSDVIFSYDLNFTILDVSPSVEKVLGYKPGELVGKSFSEANLLTEDSLRVAFANAKRALSGEKIGPTDYVFITKEGMEKFIEVTSAPLYRDEEIIAVLSVARDISVRKEAEQARRESEERYRDLVETTGDLVQSVTPDDSIVFVNRAWRETLGYSEEEIRSMKILDIIHPDSQAHCMEIFQRVVAGEKTENIEAKFLTKDGRIIFVEGSASCRFVDGRPVTTYGIFHNITERREAEEAKRRLEAEKLIVERMKELERMKDEFISTVTHELRTPMTPLKSTIEMLLDGSLGELTDRQEKFIRMMARNVDRLAQFTTEVLTLSRLESGRYKLAPRVVSLRETIEPVMELMQQKAQSKNSTVSLDIDSEMSAYADPDSLSIVITNLTNNAIVHTPEGTAVTVSGKLEKDLVEVSVSDTGQGIPEESLEHLFDRFYQAKRETGPGYHGTGVGLAVSKALIEAMGGEISVESHVGEGTVFKFTLPASPPRKENEGAKE